MYTTKGQIYIGFIIAIGILLILGTAVITLIVTTYELISFTRSRTNARYIASERIEVIRNLPFDDVGTLGGIPPGNIPQTETIIQNTLAYTIYTSIIYVDDPFDNIAPVDLLPNDYKKARVDVSWGGVARSGKNTVTLITDIAPKGIETTAGGGTLSVLVFDANAVPVSQASVTIVANETTPQINLTLDTNDSGRVILPGAPVCDSCYQITVTKEGHSTERTYGTEEISNPDKPHLTMIEGELIEISFAIDLLGTLNLSTVNDKDNYFTPLANQVVRLTGSKILGYDSSDQTIYKFDQEVVTDSAGSLTIEEFEWDNYEVTLPADSTKDIYATNPLIPLLANPGETIDFTISLTPESNHSLLAVFSDGSENLIASVSATLSDDGEFEEDQQSGSDGSPDFGQVFFSNLENKTYTLTATVSGFLDYNNTVDVDGDTREEVILEAE